MEGLILFLGLFSWANTDFFNTVTEQQAEGYRWEQIECRQADPSLPSLTVDTPTGKKLVCWKLVK